MSDNVVKSSDLPEPTKAPAEKAATKKAPAKKTTAKKAAPKAEKSPVPKKTVSKASAGKKFIYFASGSAYSTKNGIRFTRENRIYEIEKQEADHLLTLDNFRLPTQLELEDHYKENN
tara:strand:+ start:3226 stop:3576 length:351 start_codon:yes stop_codon:yes gene_type:complete